jgi:D-glycero-D-manno-heptose 1,7-bisphosphate phosphatase
MMQALVLIGGLGTRLGDLVKDRPKPLLPVAGKPFLEYLLLELRRHGIIDIVLLAGYRADAVEQQYGVASGAGDRLGINITVLVEKQPLGTAGALKLAKQHLRQRFFLLNGDSLFDFNLLDLPLPSVPSERAPVTMSLRRVADARRYGIVETHGGRVTAFREKSADHQSGLINAGVYWMDKSIVERVDRLPCSLERDILPRLVFERQIVAKTYDGYFVDIGIPADLARADRELAAVLTRPAVFFDRDDTLIYDPAGYTHKPADLRWVEGVPAMIKRLNDAGMLVFVVTNQAGVAKGHFAEPAIRRFHDHMARELAAVGAHIDDWRYCPHHEAATVDEYRMVCAWRKPSPGMLLDLLSKWSVDRAASIVFGNSDSDVIAGKSAGIAAQLVAPGAIVAAVNEFLAVSKT